MNGSEGKARTEPKVNNRAFRSIFRSILILIPVPVVMIVVVELAALFSVERLADDFETKTIKRVLTQIEQDFSQAKLALNKLKSDETIRDYIKKSERDYYDEMELHSQLQSLAEGYSNIEEIYLYFPEYEYVISTSLGGKERELYLAGSYECSLEDWLEAIDSGWTGVTRTLAGTDGEVKNIISAKISSSTGQNSAQAVISLSTEYLLDILEGLSLQEGEEAFVYADDSTVAATIEGNWDSLISVFEQAREGKSGKVELEGETYQATFAHSVRTGLTLVLASPRGGSWAALDFVKLFGVGLSVAGTLTLIVLAFLVARRNYIPIQCLLNAVKDTDKTGELVMDDLGDLEVYMKKAIRTREAMDEKIRQYEADMRQLRLGQILFQGTWVNQPEEIIREWGFREAYYAVLMCVFEETEENVLADAVENAGKKDILTGYMQEFFPEISCFYLMEGRAGFFCIINGAGASPQAYWQKLSDDRDRMKEAIAGEEGIFCNFYLSSVCENVIDIHRAYEEVKGKYVNKEIQDKIGENENCSVERIVELIRESLPDANLSVNGIADRLEVSPSHLSRYFKNKMGIGVLEYIHRERVRLAKNMLRDSADVKIRDVAEQTGFCNITTFIRVFKKIEGVTPGQYREALDEEKH